jgi:hypothetical protein
MHCPICPPGLSKLRVSERQSVKLEKDEERTEDKGKKENTHQNPKLAIPPNNICAHPTRGKLFPTSPCIPTTALLTFVPSHTCIFKNTPPAA